MVRAGCARGLGCSSLLLKEEDRAFQFKQLPLAC